MNDGIKYGKGLFETIKVKDSKPIYWWSGWTFIL